MSVIYITDHGSLVSFQGNRIIVTDKDDEQQSFPVETVEGITLLSMSQLTTQCIEQCLIKGITVSFLSKGGTYFGRLISTGHVDSALQRKQSSLYNTDFSIELGRIILTAKLKNQLTVLRRYAKSRGVDIDNEINMIKSCERSINSSVSIPQIMGYEGQAAKTYFSGLNKCVDDEFHFDCRSRRPPKDEFNSMLSFGYSILINEIYSEIAAKGLNPYFGFVHQDKEKHPTLASDLVEEWRTVIVDSMVMSLVNGHEIQKSNFETDVNVHGYYLNNEGLKIFVKKLDGKLRTGNKYLDYSDDRVSFRVAISYQISHLIEAINKKDASIYKPILIR